MTDAAGASSAADPSSAATATRPSLHADVVVARGETRIAAAFDVASGHPLAVIGPNGAGKSTLVNLLLRFHETESGRILVDGQDIAGVAQESLRAAQQMLVAWVRDGMQPLPSVYPTLATKDLVAPNAAAMPHRR